MSGETIRVERKERDYFSAQNEPFNDARLSFGARGLLAYILSKPNDWEVRNEDLIRQSPAGKAAVLGMLGELKKYGYMNRHRENRAGGYLEWVTVIYEIPSLNPDYQETSGNDDLPKSDSPKVGKPDFGADRSPIYRRSVKPKFGKSGDIVSTDVLLSTDKELSTDVSVSLETEAAKPQHPEKTLSDSDTDETQQTNRLTLREIKKLKLSPAEWRTMLDAENAEGQRKTVIEYIEQRLNMGPAAVQVYREISDRFPAKALWPMITEAVGDAPEDLERWRQTVLAHRAIGWNPSNIQLMIEFYKTNRLAGDDKNGQQARTTQDRDGSTGTETGGARKFINVSAGATPAQEIAAKNRGRLERLIAAKSAI